MSSNQIPNPLLLQTLDEMILHILNADKIYRSESRG